MFVLIINSDSDWNQRFDLLFDLFVCVGSEELAYDDVCQACLTVAKSIHRLCVAPKDEDILATNGGDDVVHLWKHAEWIYIVEALVKEAFLKVTYIINFFFVISIITYFKFLSYLKKLKMVCLKKTLFVGVFGDLMRNA